MLELLRQPWPWYVSGSLIALIMILLLFSGKTFGFSSNLRILCAMCGAGKRVKFFDIDWKSQSWNLLFLVGAIIGGLISSRFLQSGQPLQISAATMRSLHDLGIQFDGRLNPLEVFNWEFLFSLKGFTLLVVGGFLVGFGSRYAGGCTSGHAITGLSNLQLPSLIAVIGFFIGGLIVTYVLLPILLS